MPAANVSRTLSAMMNPLAHLEHGRRKTNHERQRAEERAALDGGRAGRSAGGGADPLRRLRRRTVSHKRIKQLGCFVVNYYQVTMSRTNESLCDSPFHPGQERV